MSLYLLGFSVMSQATLSSPVSMNTPPDDLGIDREFILSMARIPVVAVFWILGNFLTYFIWNQMDPESSRYSPLAVISFGMLLAAFIDGWAFKVPNWCTLSLVLSGWVIGLFHDLSIPIDQGVGGIGSSMLCTLIGFLLLGPLLAISGMGQGDVKMTMGFGAWVGAYFGGRLSFEILAISFCIGAVVGGVFGLIMMVLRRKFSQNASNFREIFTDLRVLVTQGPSQAAARGYSRRSRWDKLPYGVPLCVGFLGYLWYLWINNQLPGQ